LSKACAANTRLPQLRNDFVIAVDPDVAPIVGKLFEWYATGQYSLKELARKAGATGFDYTRSGNRVPPSTLQTILRNRLYNGSFVWNGKLYQGTHEPLVSVELWGRVQGVMDGRHAKKHRRMTHDFAFSGLIACSKCGCSVVGEIKKQKYIYYHCTGYANKCRGEPATCRRKYVREEVLEQQFTDMLGRLRFDDEVLEWIGEALHASHADERRENEEAIRRLQVEHKRLGDPHKHFVEMPSPSGIRSMLLDTPLPNLRGEHRTKPVPPETYCLVADIDAAFKQQVFDLPQRQRIADVMSSSLEILRRARAKRPQE